MTGVNELMEGEWRLLAVAVALALFAAGAYSSAKTPTEVKIVSPSAPPSQPTEVKIISAPPPSPTEVKIVDQPRDESAAATVRLTRWLVIWNGALCLITVAVAISQGRDARKAIAAARQAAEAASVSADASSQSARASARETRVAFEREVHVSAHRVAVQATLLRNMLNELKVAYQLGFVMAGQSPANSSRAKIYEDVHQQRNVTVETIMAEANGFAELKLSDRSDDALIDHLKQLDALTVQVEALKEQVARDRDTVPEASEVRERLNNALMNRPSV